ncbi:gamma-glutamyl-gamma-aminobutyrate hydrolase family protein [Maribellus maritimus]|uniref:gamma-glutamyl-gamma-aminobutyrate hydrolase family protein n=1 Tax=Maribellus maritimus TaxID=2870838 RepID=UPI001EEA90C9|nr:gamma-glutamyl-gamma-aminobutyrate hydrolase family protein [Maribellus maritimus]MCG6187756.1 gamma-glutamyl-gamma-aminobutyrate hydrolase family protein [Maribellus maritimus]
MKKSIFLLFLAFTVVVTSAQDFFHQEFNNRKKYVLLTNPTVRNLQTVRYLENAGLLDIKKGKTRFVGVYFEGQNYDFDQTKAYIEENNLKNFYLHEIKGDLTEDNLFKENECTPDLELIFKNSVGVFFFGGPDIPPGVYGEENTRSIVTDPGRHYFETTFLFHLLGSYRNEQYEPFLNKKPKYLVTGFCLGMQTMNVATGGTLIQDIPAEIFGAENPEAALKIGRANLHRNYWQEIVQDTLLMGINLHTIRFTDNPFFGDVVKVSKRWEPRIYSSHHQAAEKLGKGLEVTALSPDGKIVEGIVHSVYPNVFAVQFHPEVPGLYEDLYMRKFHPEDEAMSYNDIIGKQSVKFHERYWEHISKIIRKAKTKR